ncbi:hypothetical protein ACIQRS_19610 [Streptomyces termitum]|uniref:Secreted protein n=1 Tax=Streptomyces termitum TaxID=67368 RepID=A0A918T862_9ACTN|nr:hypothetical protein [Streptomyces termitum]GHB05078.1 hypothetical protein GCM10010305_55340 [Streptomyces termitum]
MVRTRLKMAATLTVVVLALTGFQTSTGGSGSGSGKSGKSKSKGGGGGCSSSKKSNHDYDDDSSGDFGGSGSGSSTTPTPSPSAEVEVVVVDCVKPAQKKAKGRPARSADTTATLRITSHAAARTVYRIKLEFKNAAGSAVDTVDAGVTVEPNETKTFEVAMKAPKTVDRVRNCWVYDVREA